MAERSNILGPRSLLDESSSSDSHLPPVVAQTIGEVLDDNSWEVAEDNNFWMFEYKVKECAEHRWHRWDSCFFSHPGEPVRRRDPRIGYSSLKCNFFRPGQSCPRGNECRFAHGHNERYLHPDVFRTTMCNRQNCKVKPCYHAHSEEQLRSVTQRHQPYSQAVRYRPGGGTVRVSQNYTNDT